MASMLVMLNFLTGLSMFAVTPITPIIIDDYTINRTNASLLVSLIPFIHIFVAIPSAVIVNKIRLKNGLVLALILTSAPCLTIFAQQFWMLLVIRLCYAIGLSLAFPALLSIATQWLNHKELPVFNGALVTGFSLAIAASTVIVSPMSDIFGWKNAISLIGLAPIIGLAMWMALGYRQRSKLETAPVINLMGIFNTLKSKTTILLAMGDAGPFALMMASIAWLPTLYYEKHNIPLSDGGSLMGIMSIAGTVSLVASSILVIKIPLRRPFLIIPGLIIGFAGIGSFLLVDTILLIPSLVLLGFACWFYTPILFTIPMELPGSDTLKVSLVVGALMSVGSFFGFISPLIVGLTVDILGNYSVGLTVFSVLSVSLLVAGYFLPETGSRGNDDLRRR